MNIKKYAIGVMFLCAITAISMSMMISAIYQPKEENLAPPPAQKEDNNNKKIPKEVEVIINRIKEKNITTKNVMDEISTTNSPQKNKNDAFISVNVLYIKALREGMDNGRDAYLDGKIDEEKLMIQMEKAEKLMDEALEKAKKALEKLKTAPKQGGFNLFLI